MAEYVSVATPWGDLTFDLDEPLLFKGQVFNTYEEAHAELVTLDARSFPRLRQTSEGKWAILVHSQKREERLLA